MRRIRTDKYYDNHLVVRGVVKEMACKDRVALRANMGLSPQLFHQKMKGSVRWEVAELEILKDMAGVPIEQIMVDANLVREG